MKEFKAPSLAVLDEAIALIESGEKHYSCHALHKAARRVENSLWPRQKLYAKQYEEYVFKKARRIPIWWSNWVPTDRAAGKRAKTARLRALRGFRQACIDAVKG